MGWPYEGLHGLYEGLHGPMCTCTVHYMYICSYISEMGVSLECKNK